jgi:hypothetical protein
MLTVYALGANPKHLQRHYTTNATYQRPSPPIHKKDIEAMSDPAKFKEFLGRQESYHDFLIFFQREIEANGWQAVVNEYLFKGDERADGMLARMFAGFLHPIIHLGFGIEFGQPAIVAEALAQAAVVDNWIEKVLFAAEKAARENPPKDGGKTLVQLLKEIHDDEELRAAPHWSDVNKIRDGIVARAGGKMLSYAAQYVIRPEDDLEQKTAEMINATALFTGSAQHPPKVVKFDFFFMHCVNCSIFFSTFLSQDWLSDANKRRLLEWKGRNNLVLYASRRAPDILVDEIRKYKPKEPGSDVFQRVLEIGDDGHASKLIRALAHGKEVCKRYEGSEGFEVQGDMWDKLLHMAIDSVEGPDKRWVRSAGFDEAWEGITERPMAAL